MSIATMPIAPSHRKLRYVGEGVPTPRTMYFATVAWLTSMLRDRDTSYGSVFNKWVAAMGITEVVTAPRSPWQSCTSSA